MLLESAEVRGIEGERFNPRVGHRVTWTTGRNGNHDGHHGEQPENFVGTTRISGEKGRERERAFGGEMSALEKCSLLPQNA